MKKQKRPVILSEAKDSRINLALRCSVKAFSRHARGIGRLPRSVRGNSEPFLPRGRRQPATPKRKIL